MTRRTKREFTDAFKQQIVQLYNSGKPRSEIIKEYDLTPSAFDKWVSRINATGSTKESDNRSPEAAELLKLRAYYGVAEPRFRFELSHQSG